MRRQAREGIATPGAARVTPARRIGQSIRLGALIVGAYAATSLAAEPEALRAFTAATPAALERIHAGRPYVLVLWSSTCAPCRDELPRWAERQRAHPQVPIEIVSIDDIEESAAAQRLLDSAGLLAGRRGRFGSTPGTPWIFADHYVERLRHAIDPAWHGEVPRTYFFDARHRPTAASGTLDAGKVDAWLRNPGGKS